MQEIAQELNQIREQLRTSEERHTADKDGSLFALQTAQAHLKERYARMKKENEELQKHLTEYNQKQVFYLCTPLMCTGKRTRIRKVHC